MTNGAVALLLIALAAGLIVLRPKVKFDFLKSITARISAGCFAASGLYLTHGWIGDGIGWCVKNADKYGGELTSAAFGSAAIWVLYLAFTAAWVICFIPSFLIDLDMPDALSAAGVFLIPVTRHIPGGLGQTTHHCLVWLGHLLGGLTKGALS